MVERADRVGGLAGSFDVDGIRVDFGSHRLHPSIDPVVLGALARLPGLDLQVRPRHGRIRLAGRWVAFPLRAGDLVRRLPPRFAARALVDTVTGPARRSRADTFVDVVRAGLGPAVAEQFYVPYVRKIWGVDPGELSGELARRRVSARSPVDVARQLVRSRASSGPTFFYPRRGFGAICDALAEAAVGAGAVVRLGAEVSGLALGGASSVVRLRDGGAIEASHVWSTLPLPALAGMVDPPPPPDVVEAAGALSHRGMVLAYLVVDGDQYTEFDAHYFPDADTPLSRLSEPKNYRDGPDPSDRTVLCAELPCTAGDELWSTGDADVGELVATSLAAQGLPPVRPRHVETRRVPRVYPVYRRGFEWDLAMLELWVGAQPGLTSLGRQGLFAPDNTHHALAMGWAAADALRPDGTFDDAAWAAARERFRTHVVED